MKRIPFIISIITLSFTLVACGDNVSATTTPEVSEEVEDKTEVVATPTTESPDEGKETPAVEPTAEPEPTEEVVEPEPTVKPEPDIPLPELSIDVDKYFNDECGFDFYEYGFAAGSQQPLVSSHVTNFGFDINGWLIMVSGTPYRTLRATKMYDYSDPDAEFEPGWIIRYPNADDDIKITFRGESRDGYPSEAINDLLYLMEWCKDNPYSGEKPTLYSSRWIKEEEE